MKIQLNGEKTETSSRTVAELVRETKAPDSGVAVALNGVVVRRSEWENAALKESDEIEIIRAVQGG